MEMPAVPVAPPPDSTGAPEPPPGLITESPCIGVCALDDGDVCRGCGRSRAEIAAWGTLGTAERDAINRRILPAAHPAVRIRLLGHAGGRQPRRGGRGARRG